MSKNTTILKGMADLRIAIKSATAGDGYYLNDNWHWGFDGRFYDLFFGHDLVNYWSDPAEFLKAASDVLSKGSYTLHPTIPKSALDTKPHVSPTMSNVVMPEPKAQVNLAGFIMGQQYYSENQMREYAQAEKDAAMLVLVQQPRLKVHLTSFPESNGKRNWTALLVRAEQWEGLVGNCGGISLARGEYWNRVAYEAECTRFLIGERDTEPHILDYGDDIKTPDEWKGEIHGGRSKVARTALTKEPKDE